MLYSKLVLISAALLLSACGQGEENLRPGKDIITLESPDGLIVASVREVDLGGSIGVSQWYQIHLSGKAAGSKQEIVMTADKTDGLHLKWLNSENLLICYHTAKIRSFINYYSLKTSEMEYRDVELHLKKDPLGTC